MGFQSKWGNESKSVEGDEISATKAVIAHLQDHLKHLEADGSPKRRIACILIRETDEVKGGHVVGAMVVNAPSHMIDLACEYLQK